MSDEITLVVTRDEARLIQNALEMASRHWIGICSTPVSLTWPTEEEKKTWRQNAAFCETLSSRIEMEIDQ